jgi:hypothetical protein
MCQMHMETLYFYSISDDIEQMMREEEACI